jgi:hypothetical protein
LDHHFETKKAGAARVVAERKRWVGSLKNAGLPTPGNATSEQLVLSSKKRSASKLANHRYNGPWILTVPHGWVFNVNDNKKQVYRLVETSSDSLRHYLALENICASPTLLCQIRMERMGSFSFPPLQLYIKQHSAIDGRGRQNAIESYIDLTNKYSRFVLVIKNS